MTFRGLHEHSLDSKDRITIPAGYRGALAEGVVLMKSLESCVEVWPQSAAEEMERRTLSPLNAMSRDARRIQRRFFANSEAVELDSAGRIRLSGQLIEHAGLSGRCVISGMGDRLEIWSPEEWDREAEENDDKAPLLAEQLAEAQQAVPMTFAQPQGQR